jgi:DNA-binding response OmpR family regulator
MPSPVREGRQPAVLLVEDDELARDALARALVREGYLVLTAGTGHDAVGLMQTPSIPIDVVLLDIGLPDVSGADLLVRLREYLPYLPVVVCTGAASAAEVKKLHDLGVSRFFQKPVDMEELAAALRAALAPPP